MAGADEGNPALGEAQEQPSTSNGAPQLEQAGEEEARLQEIRRKGEGQYGCKHYRRRVKFITPCCNEEFWCRHCHNEVKYQQETDWKRKHELDRKAITEVVCALCETRQPVGEFCSSCGASFGAYACTKCPFFDDDLTKRAYHCEDCGICRIGGRENYFHCKTCASCYSVNLRGNHKCVDRAMHQNCPVCFEYLFESVDPTTVLRCGHTIHSQCLKDLEASQTGICPMCPICKKSLGDYSRYWRTIDQQIARSPVPHEYHGWRADILCNDCSESANIPFNIIGLKCPACGSYNTRRMGLHTTQPAGLGAGGALDPAMRAAAAMLAARRGAGDGAGDGAAGAGPGPGPGADGAGPLQQPDDQALAGLQAQQVAMLQALLAAENEAAGGEDEEGDEDDDFPGILGDEDEEEDEGWETASTDSGRGGEHQEQQAGPAAAQQQQDQLLPPQQQEQGAGGGGGGAGGALPPPPQQQQAQQQQEQQQASGGS